MSEHPDGIGTVDPMHREPSGVDGPGLAEGGPGSAGGPPRVPCRCGCGRLPTLDADGRPRRFVRGHHRRSSAWGLVLASHEREAILGTLLGDSSIAYPNPHSVAPRLYFNHGGPQRGWAAHKASFLRRLLPRTRESVCGGYGETTISVATSCLPCLEPIHGLVVRDGRKRISREWLDGLGSVGLAWWIGDDGSASGGNSLILHTEGYPEEDVQIAADWFGERYGPARISRSKGKYFFLYIGTEARRAIYPTVGGHMPDCMGYKMRGCEKSYRSGRSGRLRHHG